MSKLAYIGLGSNLGNRMQNLERAKTFLEEFAGEIMASSSVYETSPWGFDSEQQFLNAVVELKTALPPEELLKILRGIELQMGRVRSSAGGYQSRTIDLDILDYDEMVLETKELTLPHPRMHLRKFVLVPLAEIAPLWSHSRLNTSLNELLNRLKSDETVTKSVDMKV